MIDRMQRLRRTIYRDRVDAFVERLSWTVLTVAILWLAALGTLCIYHFLSVPSDKDTFLTFTNSLFAVFAGLAALAWTYGPNVTEPGFEVTRIKVTSAGEQLAHGAILCLLASLLRYVQAVPGDGPITALIRLLSRGSWLLGAFLFAVGIASGLLGLSRLLRCIHERRHRINTLDWRYETLSARDRLRAETQRLATEIAMLDSESDERRSRLARLEGTHPGLPAGLDSPPQGSPVTDGSTQEDLCVYSARTTDVTGRETPPGPETLLRKVTTQSNPNSTS